MNFQSNHFKIGSDKITLNVKFKPGGAVNLLVYRKGALCFECAGLN
jgi:hypothetical protein